MHKGELPVLKRFLDVVLDLEDKQKWTALVAEFGKYRTLNSKTANFTTQGYTTLTRMIEMLGIRGLTDQFSESLDRLKVEVGKRF